MEPIVFGDYPKIMRDLVKERLPLFTEEEKKLIKGSFDFIGINYYTTRYGKNVPASQAEPLSYHNDVLATSTETNANGVLIGPHADGSIYIFSYPQGLQKLLEFMKQNYQSPKIYISENGITEEKDDNLGLDVAVKDPHRIECILRHLYRIRMAMKNGVNVKGYFHWALFDDFEWGEGYSSDFTMSTTKTISSAFLKNLLSGYQISWLGCHIWYAEATRLKQMRHLNKEEFVHVLRRQSNGASRGNSKLRGVAAAAAAAAAVAAPKIGPFEVRMGQLIPGNKLIKCNGREGVTNFDPSIYEGAVVVDASTEGSGHNLDLSLGMSQPSTGQKRKAFEILTKEKPMVNGSASAAGGQPLNAIAMLSKHPAYSEIYPGFLHKTEEMATDHHKRIQAVSSPRFSNWAWQMNGNNNNVTPMQVFSIAASSGFSSSIATVPPSATNQLPPILQDNSTYNLRHPFPTSL